MSRSLSSLPAAGALFGGGEEDHDKFKATHLFTHRVLPRTDEEMRRPGGAMPKQVTRVRRHASGRCGDAEMDGDGSMRAQKEEEGGGRREGKGGDACTSITNPPSSPVLRLGTDKGKHSADLAIRKERGSM